MPLTQPQRWSGNSNRPSSIALPPAHMPLFKDGTLLKRWRYVAVWTKEVSAYAGTAHVGPIPQKFWAVYDRANNRFIERTSTFNKGVQFPTRRMHVLDGEIEIDLALDEDEGFEVASPQGRAYTWTRKQLIPARGTVRIGTREFRVADFAFIDDNAGYHARRTSWRWCGGVGTDTRGRRIAWNAIQGLNDTPGASENTIWIDNVAQEIGTINIAPDLSTLTFAEGGELRFHQETTRERKDNFIIIRSDYAQPLGTFTGTLPDGTELREAYGVMERQEALW